jgi:predicted AAA+ superfamily ATPase
MQRLIYNDLILWKNSEKRKPLLLQGARQVGKTWIVNQFGKSEYAQYIRLNFEEDPELKKLFHGLLDPNYLIEKISLYIGKKITSNDTLIFFDEIQTCPEAISSLKYFYEKSPEYHIVAAGSLLGVSLGKTSSFPVGKVNFLSVYPMSFSEYLQAVGEELIAEHLLKNGGSEAFPDLLHDKIEQHFKMYLYLGGMPEVVQNYIDQKDIVSVRKIQNDILQSYLMDFSKYTSPKEAVKLTELWNSIPFQLAKENKKFKFSDIKSKSRAVHFEETVAWLKAAGLIYVVFQLRDAKLPLGGYADYSKFKIYMLDSGLLGAMLGLTSNIIIQPDALFKEYNGAFIENYVCCELTRNLGKDIFYWTSDREAEVDFVFQHEDDIIPIEVKSGTNRNTKGLRIFESKYQVKHLIRISPRNMIQSDNFINIPLYSTISLKNILPKS